VPRVKKITCQIQCVGKVHAPDYMLTVGILGQSAYGGETYEEYSSFIPACGREGRGEHTKINKKGVESVP